MKQLLVEIYCMFLGFVVGFLFGSAWYDSQPETPKPLVDVPPKVVLRSERPWRNVPWFLPAMGAISVMESSGGTNQKPNVDGIIGIGQVERDFYQDAKEYCKGDFPTYKSLQGYDEEAFNNTCIVTWYWFKRYKANTPYLMFARYRKGPSGEKTATGQAYANKALRIMNEKYL